MHVVGGAAHGLWVPNARSQYGVISYGKKSRLRKQKRKKTHFTVMYAHWPPKNQEIINESSFFTPTVKTHRDLEEQHVYFNGTQLMVNF